MDLPGSEHDVAFPVAASVSPQTLEELMAPQTLSEFMGTTPDDLLATDIDTLHRGLTLLVRRLLCISEERLALQATVARDMALRAEAPVLGDVKSGWQSILRTLRAINEF